MRALDRKLIRDLRQIWGQGIAIALVIATGVAMILMYFSTFDALDLTLTSYYERYRFGEVFAGLKRAPLGLADRIERIPGVSEVEPRVVVEVTLDIAGLEEPAVGRLMSIPERRVPVLNDVFLRQGRYIEPGRPDEVLLAEAFAEAHDLGPGDSLAAVINGRRRELKIVGVALSPEFVYSIRPGSLLPDDDHFAVLWMGRRALAAAFEMEGGFNEVSLLLQPGASEPEVIRRLDSLLERYGGLGAIPRRLQISDWFIAHELAELKTIGTIVPTIFLAVAAFLLNIVLGRIVAVQREQIAVLKALGYTNLTIGVHYTKLALLIAVFGSLVGVAAGAWMGSGMTGLYGDYFRFPILEYRLSPLVIVAAVAVSLAAAALGAFGVVLRVARLPPAEAMRPEPPANYRETLLERLGLKRILSPAARMIVRDLRRRPVRAGLSVLGISMAGAMLVVGAFFLDGLDHLLEVEFQISQRQDVTVAFVEPASGRALHEIRRLPGVISGEPFRAVPARLRFGHRSRNEGILGLPAEAELYRLLDRKLAVLRLPAEGLVLSSKLAEILAAAPGDLLTVEVLDGKRPVRRVPVTAIVDPFMGTGAYMEIGALRRLVEEGRTLSGAHLQVDAGAVDALYRRLKKTPAVGAVSLKRAAIDGFEATLAETMDIMIFFNIAFAVVIAFGVVYNTARILLSEKQRDLASLRVLGFTRGEISFILLGELALLTLAAVPVGMLLGYLLAGLTAAAVDSELFRFPWVIDASTYAFSAVIVIVAALLSGLAVRRRLHRLDLIAALKTRE